MVPDVRRLRGRPGAGQLGAAAARLRAGVRGVRCNHGSKYRRSVESAEIYVACLLRPAPDEKPATGVESMDEAERQRVRRALRVSPQQLKQRRLEVRMSRCELATIAGVGQMDIWAAELGETITMKKRLAIVRGLEVAERALGVAR